MPAGASTGNQGPYASADTSGTAPPPVDALFTPRTPKLIRPRSPRVIAGVCAAFALHYGWNLVAVRIVTAIIGLTTGVGALAYIICWIAIPEGQYALPPDAYR